MSQGVCKVLTDYARTIGWLSIALGVCCFFKPRLLNLFPFDPPHLVIHLLLGIAGIYFAQSYVPELNKRWFATICGALLLSGGIAGFFINVLGSYQFTTPQNMVNLILGSWGLWLTVRRYPSNIEEDC